MDSGARGCQTVIDQASRGLEYQSIRNVDSGGSESVMEQRFKVNDWVICTREKYGLSPGRRAKNISPAPHGDLYSYEVDKYWIVREVGEQDLVLETRTGKQHVVSIKDRRIRVAAWWERWLYRNRFPIKAGGGIVQCNPPTPPNRSGLTRSA
jgi:hypothetical protein